MAEAHGLFSAACVRVCVCVHFLFEGGLYPLVL